MLGIAIDPEFFANRYVYVYYMEPLTVATARPVVVRFTEQDGRGIDPQVILGDLPPTQPPYFNHVAGHIHFGPDGYLYVSIGDYGGTPESAQDLSTVRGKLLRVQRDGSPAPGNPFNGRAGADARVFAYGLRNSFDFTFEPGTGRIYASENGPDRCDELNFIVPGHNYGWPFAYSGDSCISESGTQAIYYFARKGKQPWQSSSTTAPTGIEFMPADAYAFSGSKTLLACEWLTGAMWLLQLSEDGGSVLKRRLLQRDCQLDLTRGPDGLIYYSNAGEIRRLQPVN